MIVLALLALRGSPAAFLLWLGALLFSAYNYVIYTIGIPFGPLFLLWVGVLALSIFALLGGAACINRDELLVTYRSRHAPQVSAWALIVIALMFAALWLSEDVPALLNGTTPQSLVDQGMITNPVHVLDLGFFLPAVLVIGALWLRRNPRAATVAPSFLVFLFLTGLPILVTPIVQSARGETAAWGVVVPIGTVTIVVVLLLAWLLHSMTIATPVRTEMGLAPRGSGAPGPQPARG
jgi:cytochrome bd-type quinol oxidase subunit 2